MTQTDVVDIDHLEKSYGDQRVLAGVSVTIPGGIVALLGRNGAGKTTLINILTTLVRPDRGIARVCGLDVVARRAQVRARIAVTGQYAAVDEILTGRENLVMMGRLFGLSGPAARRRADELLAGFDLTDAASRQVRRYSGGMRRRLDLAICLLRPQRVIFLDEPTTGLDAPSRQALWDQVRTIGRTGDTAVFLTTQYLPEAEELADRVLVLDGGRIVADGSVSALTSVIGADVVEVRDALGRVERTVPTDGSAAGVAAVLDQLAPDTRVTVRAPSLDEVFIRLTTPDFLERIPA